MRIGHSYGETNTLTANLEDVIYLGTQTRLKLRVGDTGLEAVVNPNEVEGLSRGDRGAYPSAACDTLGDSHEIRDTCGALAGTVDG